MGNKINYSLKVVQQASPLLIDLQTRFLQIKTLSEQKSVDNIAEIELLSKHALATLDYTLFALDAHQLSLPFTTVSAAAVASDVAHELTPLAKAYNVDIQLDAAHALEPVFANEAALRGSLHGLLSSLISARPSDNKPARVIIAAQQTLPTTQRLGVYSSDIIISNLATKQARSLAGQTRSVAPADLHHSGVGLVATDQLLKMFNSSVKSFKHKGMQGLGFYVPLSTQLSLL